MTPPKKTDATLAQRVAARLPFVLAVVFSVFGAGSLVAQATAPIQVAPVAAHVLDVPSADKLEHGDVLAAVVPDDLASSASNQTPKIKPRSSNGAARGTKSLGREGISLSGWWVFDIKNPDGTVASHKELENNITGDGMRFLIYLLAGHWATGDPFLNISGAAGSPCNGPVGCLLLSNANLTEIPGATDCGQYPTACSFNLTSTVVQNITTPFAHGPLFLTLAGSIVATQDGGIDQVNSFFGYCAESSNPQYTAISPQACVNNQVDIESTSSFTGASLPLLSVHAGQTVQVSVTFSFAIDYCASGTDDQCASNNNGTGGYPQVTTPSKPFVAAPH